MERENIDYSLLEEICQCGKYKGKTVSWIIDNDVKYMIMLIDGGYIKLTLLGTIYLRNADDRYELIHNTKYVCPN